MPERRNTKVCSLKEAVSRIKDGDRIAFGGFAVYQKPMAIVHEIIRAKKKNLTVVGVANSIEVDMLAGAGCIDKIETSYVGLEKFGLAQNFRRAVQDGRIKITHYPELLSWDRFRANQEGFSFWPVDFLGGSDIVNKNDLIKNFDDPITGKKLWAVPAANVDAVLLHMYCGDKYGNLQTQQRRLNPQTVDITLSRACKTVIATVEKIVDTETIMSRPHLTAVPSFRTTSVTEVPNGSHPTPVMLVTKTDVAHFNEYVEASKSDEAFQRYLEKYVYGVNSFDEYLDLVGRKQVKALSQEGL